MTTETKITYQLVGHVLVDSGQIEMGDCGDVHLQLPTLHGDGIYAVRAVMLDGELHGYYVSADSLDMVPLRKVLRRTTDALAPSAALENSRWDREVAPEELVD